MWMGSVMGKMWHQTKRPAQMEASALYVSFFPDNIVAMNNLFVLEFVRKFVVRLSCHFCLPWSEIAWPWIVLWRIILLEEHLRTMQQCKRSCKTVLNSCFHGQTLILWICEGQESLQPSVASAFPFLDVCIFVRLRCPHKNCAGRIHTGGLDPSVPKGLSRKSLTHLWFSYQN